MSSREELARLLEPPAQAWAVPSPDEIVRGYGTALPADYMWLAQTYGLGEISRYLNIFPPLAATEIGTRSGVTPTSAERFEEAGENTGMDPAYLAPGGLVMWGFTSHDDFAFWSPVGEPDAWPVVIRRDAPQSGPNWVRYDFGVVEFLLRTFRGELPDNPFSGDDLWRNGSPTFVRD